MRVKHLTSTLLRLVTFSNLLSWGYVVDRESFHRSDYMDMMLRLNSTTGCVYQFIWTVSVREHQQYMKIRFDITWPKLNYCHEGVHSWTSYLALVNSPQLNPEFGVDQSWLSLSNWINFARFSFSSSLANTHLLTAAKISPLVPSRATADPASFRRYLSRRSWSVTADRRCG